MKIKILVIVFFIGAVTFAQTKPNDEQLINALEQASKQDLLEKWYPLAVDREDGGFYSDITYDFKIGEKQDKMIVTQARHVWVNSQAAMRYSRDRIYLSYATHGFEFLRDKMWDKKNGGFYILVTKKGERIPRENEEKTATEMPLRFMGSQPITRLLAIRKHLILRKKHFIG